MNESRWYKGNIEVKVVIKGKRKGRRGPVSWLVRRVIDGAEFVTIPRLCWSHPRNEALA